MKLLHIVRRRPRVALLLLTPFLLWGALLAMLLARPFPETDLAARLPESRRITDRDGHLLREVANSEGARSKWVPLDEMSPLVQTAIIAVEDEHFYAHGGIDHLAVIRACLQNFSSRRVVSGASTITMQLARLVRGHSRDIFGKIGQAYDALRIEYAVNKKTILEQYLNRATFGAGTVGLEAASLRIFGKPSRHLSLAEAALMAGLPQSPSRLNPLKAPNAARKRQLKVLERMLISKAITTDQYQRAVLEELTFMNEAPRLKAMHFTDYVLSLGPPPGEVTTTLASDLQMQIEKLVTEHVAAMSGGGLTNAAVVVLDNHDCSLLAMVGSAGFWAGDDGAVNGATSRRQPGSALKPFTYALAFERGFSPAAVIADIPTFYTGFNGSLYEPQNYSREYSGPVLLADALGRSLNVPAIALANAVGPQHLLAKMRAAGLHSLDAEAGHYGLGLTLGNGEVTLLELAGAYAMLANGGLRRPVRTFENEAAVEPQRVFDEQAVFFITHILSDEDLRVRAFGAATPLLMGFPMAIKTGTSSNWRDSWALGYTDRYTVGVWSGDFSGDSMDRLSGALGAGPLFHRVAKLVVGRGATPHRPKAFKTPNGVEEITVCSLSGMAPTPNCAQYRTLYAKTEDREPAPCTWHRAFRLDRRNGLLASARCPAAKVREEVFTVLPPRYASWQSEHAHQHAPTRYSPYCSERGQVADALVITNPRNHEVYIVEPGYDPHTQSLRLSGEVDPPVDEVSWLIDGVRIASVGWPYEASWRLHPGSHRIEMQAGNRRSEAVVLEVR